MNEALEVGGLEVGIAGAIGEPLLVLTRMASRAAGIWEPLIARLGVRFRVASFDLKLPPSERLDDPAALFRDYAGQCDSIATAAGYDTYRVVGWNGGSHVALRAAVDRPARVRGCVLIGAFHPLPDMRAVERGVEFMRVMLEHAGPELYSYYWFMSGLSPAFVSARFDEVERLAAARASGDRFVRADPERLRKWVRALRGQWTSDAELESMTVPVLILQPELDRWHAGPTVGMGAALAEKIAGARLEVLVGVGSLAPLEIPDVVAGHIGAFAGDD